MLVGLASRRLASCIIAQTSYLDVLFKTKLRNASTVAGCSRFVWRTLFGAGIMLWNPKSGLAWRIYKVVYP